MGASVALAIGGVISFLLNLAGFLPLLINKVDSAFGQVLKDRIIGWMGLIPQPQIAAVLVSVVAMIPSTWILSLLMWVGMALLIAGFISMVKGLKGIVAGGIIAVVIMVVVLYAPGQLQALMQQGP